jgi:hypothetical protein
LRARPTKPANPADKRTSVEGSGAEVTVEGDRIRIFELGVVTVGVEAGASPRLTRNALLTNGLVPELTPDEKPVKKFAFELTLVVVKSDEVNPEEFDRSVLLLELPKRDDDDVDVFTLVVCSVPLERIDAAQLPSGRSPLEPRELVVQPDAPIRTPQVPMPAAYALDPSATNKARSKLCFIYYALLRRE